MTPQRELLETSKEAKAWHGMLMMGWVRQRRLPLSSNFIIVTATVRSFWEVFCAPYIVDLEVTRPDFYIAGLTIS